MKYLVLFFVAFVALTYCTPDCTTYCADVMANCTNANAQYTDANTCMAQCAYWPIGTDADTSGNTVGCRTYHATVAGSSAGLDTLHCPHAGPSGGNSSSLCGLACESYCNMTPGCNGSVDTITLGTSGYSFCLNGCLNMNQSGSWTDKSGNTIFCHLYHLGVAITPATPPNSDVHCPHASPVGVGATVGCGTKCENYCAIIMNSCTGANAQFADLPTCLSLCPSLLSGNITDTAVNSVDCRIYHSLAAATDPVTHCPHASLNGGAYCPSDMCAVYCQFALQNCNGSNSIYSNMSACTTACAGITKITGNSGLATSGDSLQCRIYHLANAGTSASNAALHCPHGKTSSATCGGITGSTTSASSSGTTETTGNGFGVIVSIITLIGMLMF